jgi:hypothetical protein
MRRAIFLKREGRQEKPPEQPVASDSDQHPPQTQQTEALEIDCDALPSNPPPPENLNAVGKAEVGAKNNYALAGLILGIVSIFFYTIGIPPILAIIFSSIRYCT